MSRCVRHKIVERAGFTALGTWPAAQGSEGLVVTVKRSTDHGAVR